MQPRAFSLLVVGFTLALVAAAWVLAWWLQPVYGDLTRLGGYAEREHGWNEPVLEFDPLPTSFGEWTRPVDILVIGDSFANLRPAQQWQNHLAAQTGWSVHTLDVHRVDVDALRASPLFVEHPPKVVIWNVVERGLAADHAKAEGQCASPRPGPPLALPPPMAVAARARAVRRPHALAEANPGFARSWLYRSAMRGLLGVPTGNTVAVELVRADLFSSRASTRLLVYGDDFNKVAWSAEHLRRIRCALADLASRFQADGRTVFMTALAPDKSSAYRPWARDPSLLAAGRLGELFDGLDLPDARLDFAIRDAVELGVVDVYMPDDTHWSGAGHALAAQAIIDRLSRLRAKADVAAGDVLAQRPVAPK